MTECGDLPETLKQEKKQKLQPKGKEMKVNLGEKYCGKSIVDVFSKLPKTKTKVIIKEERYIVWKGIEPAVVTVEIVTKVEQCHRPGLKDYLLARLKAIDIRKGYEEVDIQFDMIDTAGNSLVSNINNLKNCSKETKKEILKILKTFDTVIQKLYAETFGH